LLRSLAKAHGYQLQLMAAAAAADLHEWAPSAELVMTQLDCCVSRLDGGSFGNKGLL
jgi:hypothetical protein